ncbi:MAG: galactose ABC transporter substrate-binding protein [Clostridiales bacterium]|nr:galactose ABC transporter substrate-binding protein [Clostridiales bacterium]
MYKKGLMTLLALCLCVCLAGCANNSKKDLPKTIKIGLSVYDQYDTFVSLLTEKFNHFLREKEEQEGVVITVLKESADGSQVNQNMQVEGFIRNKCDVICINLVDRTDASVIIDKAEAANIPVVFFNRELVEEDLERWEKLYYVGAEALDSGRIQGEILMENCKKDMGKVDINEDGILQYVMLEGEAGHQDAVVRTEYSVRTVVEAGYKVERLGDEIANWSKSQGESKMAQWLSEHGENIEVVFANNDDMALGAIAALKKAKVSRWPLVLGIDGTPVGLEAIKEGTMTGTALNDAILQAYSLLELSYSLATGTELAKDVPLTKNKYVRFPYKKITQENLEEYLHYYD